MRVVWARYIGLGWKTSHPPPLPPKVPIYGGGNKRRRLFGPNDVGTNHETQGSRKDVAKQYIEVPVQKDTKEYSTDNEYKEVSTVRDAQEPNNDEANQYSKAPVKEDTKMSSSENIYYEVQVQGDANKPSTLDRKYEINQYSKAPVQEDTKVSSTENINYEVQVQEDANKPSTLDREYEVNQYSKAPVQEDTKVSSTENVYYDVQVQGDANKPSTGDTEYEVNAVQELQEASTVTVGQYSTVRVQEDTKKYSIEEKHCIVQPDIKKPSTEDQYNDVPTGQNISRPVTKPKQIPPPQPIRKPTKIVVLKSPRKDEKPEPKVRKSKNSNILIETRNQSKITSLFKPLQTPNKPDIKNVSEPPQHRKKTDVAGEVFKTSINQNNLNVGESSRSLGNTCTSPDLARKTFISDETWKSFQENDISSI